MVYMMAWIVSRLSSWLRGPHSTCVPCATPVNITYQRRQRLLWFECASFSSTSMPSSTKVGWYLSCSLSVDPVDADGAAGRILRGVLAHDPSQRLVHVAFVVGLAGVPLGYSQPRLLAVGRMDMYIPAVVGSDRLIRGRNDGVIEVRLDVEAVVLVKGDQEVGLFGGLKERQGDVGVVVVLEVEGLGVCYIRISTSWIILGPDSSHSQL